MSTILKSRKLLDCRQLLFRSSCYKLLPQTKISSPYIQNRLNQTTRPGGESSQKKDDGIKYTISFKKPTDVRKIFKEFYSLYGPIFLVCHIGISLVSVGFFCSLVWLVVDPMPYIPESLINLIGQSAASITSGGGKFVVAYAIHKLILPFRLGGAIFLTRSLATKFKLKRKNTSNETVS